MNSLFFSTILRGLELTLGSGGAMETPQNGNASKWKRLNTEMPQKKAEISARKTEIPQNPVFEGFPLYFEAFPKIFEGFPLFT